MNAQFFYQIFILRWLDRRGFVVGNQGYRVFISSTTLWGDIVTGWIDSPFLTSEKFLGMDLPAEVKSVMSDLQEAITDMELTVEKLIAIPLSETHAQVKQNDVFLVHSSTTLSYLFDS